MQYLVLNYQKRKGKKVERESCECTSMGRGTLRREESSDPIETISSCGLFEVVIDCDSFIN